MKGFVIREYREGDEVRILEMFNEVFGQQRTYAHWYWKYRDNPYGKNAISLAETRDGELAAHYAGYPVPLVLPRGNAHAETRAFHMADKMTKKKFRASGYGRRSLLVRTAEHFYSTFTDEGTSFSYGFVTGNSRKLGILFLKYISIEPVIYRALDITKGQKTRFYLERFKGFTVTEERSVDAEWDQFFRNTVNDYHLLVRRDARYVHWRYVSCPDKEYRLFSIRRRGRLMGWSVFEKKGNALLWGDALFHRSTVTHLRYFLSSVISAVNDGTLKTVEGWFGRKPGWWDKALRDTGFVAMREPSALHLTIRNGSDEKIPDLLRESLYFTWGDSDLF